MYWHFSSFNCYLGLNSQIALHAWGTTERPKKNVTILIPPQKISTYCNEMRLLPLKVDTWEFCLLKEWCQYLNQNNSNHSFCNFAVFRLLVSLAQSIFLEIWVMHRKWWKHAVKSGFCCLFFVLESVRQCQKGKGTHWQILRALLIYASCVAGQLAKLQSRVTAKANMRLWTHRNLEYPTLRMILRVVSSAWLAADGMLSIWHVSAVRPAQVLKDVSMGGGDWQATDCLSLVQHTS